MWRLQKEKAGSGALGDIGAHIVDLTQFVTGQHDHRGQRTDRNVHHGTPAAGRVQRAGRPAVRPARPTGQVTVDDAALFVARLGGGAVATYEATRFATGRKNGLRVEINGSNGSLVFDLERLNELEFYDATDRPPSRASAGSWSPRQPPLPVGVVAPRPHHRLRAQLHPRDARPDRGPRHRTDPNPSFEDALRVQRVLDAVERSAKSGTWTDGRPAVPEEPARPDKGFPGPVARVGRGCAPRPRARPREGFRAPGHGCGHAPCSGPTTHG